MSNIHTMGWSESRINKSAKRDDFLNEGTSDIRFNSQKKYYGFRRFPDQKKVRKPTIKAIEVSPPKLVGHFETDRFGKNLMLDGSDGRMRVYNLPVEQKHVVIQTKDSDVEDVVDDWEELFENESKAAAPLHTVTIPDCYDLDFDLLNGYVPLKDGGNQISLQGIPCDRTAGMRWMVKNRQKLKCEDGSRLFDVDFYAGNAALQLIMSCQFNRHEKKAIVAVILFKGTHFLFLIDPQNERIHEVSNKLSFSGIRFEDYVSRGENGEESKPSSGLLNNYGDFAKYSNVVRFNFHNFKMLVTGNVDCMIPGSSAAGKKPKAEDFIELKTSAPLEDKYDKSRMSQDFCCSKSSSWFAQCVMMGVKNVVVGIRDADEGCRKITVKKTRTFTLEQLQQNSNGFWSKNQCFDVLKKFLCAVKQKVTEDNPDIINIFEVEDGFIRGPEKRTYSDDSVRYPDISEVVELMNKL
ncbi:decapping nuclease DXO homolog [Bradysia coprophila]|uniref:decapping nuclease DXO homolog n=1 Tax=Bradysia coprophila TaxID=38358 RepID=UPI00187DA4A9|nr:decapping nuclease DXO homolog [Bradysia coprophila]